ncbi:MAG: phosphotransferase family protein [Streptosporangiaceae bacterium]
MNDSAAARLTAVRGTVPLRLDGAVLVESWSNDTWVTEESVLRVCWRGDRGRLLRESALLAALPAAVPHAVVLDAGQAGDLTWMALRRIPGERLDLVWPRLTGSQRREAVTRLGAILGALHQWAAPPAVREMIRQASTAAHTTREAIGGSAIVPLPVACLPPLLEWMDRLPGMDPGLARRVRARLGELGTVISDRDLADGAVLHSDAHPANVLWHEGQVAALLDFEWARTGPPDLELEAVCRDDPEVATRAGDEPCAAGDVPVLAWLRAGYPGLFERGDLTERLWLYELCHQVRQLSAPGVTSAGGPGLGRLAILADRPRVRFP